MCAGGAAADAERQGGPRALPDPGARWRAAARVWAPRTPSRGGAGGDLGEVLGCERGRGARRTSSTWAGTRCWRRRWSSRVRERFGVEVPLRDCSSGRRSTDLAGASSEMAANRRTAAERGRDRRPERTEANCRCRSRSSGSGSSTGSSRAAPLQHARGAAPRRPARRGGARPRLARGRPPPRGAAHHLPRGATASPCRSSTRRRRSALPVVDLGALARGGARGGGAAARGRGSAAPVRPRGGPLLRARLLRLGGRRARAAADDAPHRHRRLVDGVLVRECRALYEAYLEGEDSPLAELPISTPTSRSWQRRVAARRGAGARACLLARRSWRARRRCWSCRPTGRVPPVQTLPRRDPAPSTLPAELAERLRR